MSDTKVLPAEDTEVTESDGKAHYVRTKALMAGGPVVALCGKRYVPKMIAGAEKLEVCKPCRELYDLLDRGE